MRGFPGNFHSFEYGGGKAPNRWLLAPAYTLLPLIRAPLGYDLVKPLPAIARALLVLGGGFAGQYALARPEPEDFPLLAGFALACLAAALLRFLRRWAGQGREDIHTGEAGYSFLARLLPVPACLTEILILPALIAYAGWVLWDSGASCALGVWLMLAGSSLSLMGQWEHRRHWSQARAMSDDALRAQSYGAQMQARERRARRSA